MQRNDTHIPFLDHIRGIAILMVFAFHCLGLAYGFDQLEWDGWFRDFHVAPSFLALLPATFGWMGVPIFFVVSGFCIHLSHERSSRRSTTVFLLRRFFRIYPPYLVALLIFSFFPPWHDIPFNSVDSFVQFGSHLFLAHNFSGKLFYGINSTFWSVAIEFQLYLIYPLLVLLVKRLGWSKALLLTGVLEIGLRIYAGVISITSDGHAPYWITGSPFFYWFSWSVGAAAADAFLKRRELPFTRFPVLVFPALAIATCFFKPLAMFSFPLASIATVSIMDHLLKGRVSWLKAVPDFVPRHLRFAGIVSYSVYLLHYPVIGLVPRMVAKLLPGQHPDAPLLFVIYALTWIPVAGMSWLFYRMFELPSIELGKKVIQYQSRAAEARAPLATSAAPDA